MLEASLCDGGGGQVLLLVFFCFVGGMLHSQSQLFTQHSVGQIQLTQDASTRHVILASSPNNYDVNIISTADIRTLGAYDTAWFAIPGQTALIGAEANRIEDDSSRFVWSAELLNNRGAITLSYTDGGVSGFLQIRDTFFDIIPASGPYQFFVRRKPLEKPTCALPDTTTFLPPPPGPDPSCEDPSGHTNYNTCPAIIYALVVVSPEASDYILNESGFGSIEAFIRNGQNQVNQAFANSDIPNKQILIKWIEKDFSDCVSGDIYLDRGEIPICLTSDLEENRCDVVIALTNENYTINGIYTSIGPDPSSPFAIVEAPAYASASFTLAHELGHLLGARHNWYGNFFGDDNHSVCSHAYRWFFAPNPILFEQVNHVNSWVTILGTDYPINSNLNWIIEHPSGQNYQVRLVSSTRILNYSNPDNQRGTSYANNARTIRNVACTVADFYPNQHLTLFVQASSCRVLPYTLTALITIPDIGIPGVGPYTIKWYRADISPQVLLGTGSTLTLQQHLQCPVYWIRCEVTSADNVIVNRLYKVDLRSGACICKGTIDPGGEPEQSVQVSSPVERPLYIQPNPVTEDKLSIQSPLLAGTLTPAMLMDMQGRIVLRDNMIFDAAGQSTLITKGLPDGLYLLYVEVSNNLRYSAKFIIQTP